MSIGESKTPNTLPLSSRDRDRLIHMIRKGATRRDFMAMVAAAGGTALAGGTLFASTQRATAQTPKIGGKLSVAFSVAGPDDTLDPALFTSGLDFFRGRMYYSSLTRLQRDLSYVPEVAEEVLPNADATVWTFKIRKGVEFHDGKTLTADDVVYSMNRHIGKNSVSKAAALVSMVERWEKVDNYEVRAVLSSPYADLPIVLGTFQFKIVRDGQTDFSSAPVGSGPFRVKTFTPGVRSVGTRFKNYWEDDGPYLDELECLSRNGR